MSNRLQEVLVRFSQLLRKTAGHSPTVDLPYTLKMPSKQRRSVGRLYFCKGTDDGET